MEIGSDRGLHDRGAIFSHANRLIAVRGYQADWFFGNHAKWLTVVATVKPWAGADPEPLDVASADSDQEKVRAYGERQSKAPGTFYRSK
jgi:hypothetical protein